MKWPGIIAGTIGALAMTAFFLIVQVVGGVSTPSELFADVSAPYIPVHLFGILIGLVGGYTVLKLLGFFSVIGGQFAVGIVGGILLSRAGEKRRYAVAAALVAVLWVASTIAFWPVLVTSYIGLPPGSARIATALDLLAGYLVYATTTVAMLRAATAGQDRSRGKFLAGGAGLAALATLGSGIGTRNAHGVRLRRHNVSRFRRDGTYTGRTFLRRYEEYDRPEHRSRPVAAVRRRSRRDAVRDDV